MNEPILSGLCECGCGGLTALAQKTNTAEGYRKGQPRRFIAGHSNRVMPGRKRTPAHAYAVEDRGYVTPCWVWQRGLHRKGYGLTHILIGESPRRYKTVLAHVLYWEEKNGPVPEGKELDHLCRVRPCCNPDHTEPVTHLENIRRGAKCKANRLVS